MPPASQTLFGRAGNGAISQEEFGNVLEDHGNTAIQKAEWTGKAFNLFYAEVQRIGSEKVAAHVEG